MHEYYGFEGLDLPSKPIRKKFQRPGDGSCHLLYYPSGGNAKQNKIYSLNLSFLMLRSSSFFKHPSSLSSFILGGTHRGVFWHQLLTQVRDCLKERIPSSLLLIFLGHTWWEQMKFNHTSGTFSELGSVCGFLYQTYELSD